MKIKCPYCEYIWEPTKKFPKACPRCKTYFYRQTPINIEENLKIIP